MIQITHLHQKDVHSADALAHILIDSWRSGFQGILPEDIIKQYTQFEPCTDLFRQILTSGVGTLYLAELEGQPAGLLYWLPDEDSARIEALLTIPEAWGKGVAAALIQQTLADAASFHTVRVWPFAENHRARRFYEKHNFSPSGSTRMGDAEEMEYILMIT